MKLSELLAEHPHLDPDLDISNEMVLDALYMFRVIDPYGEAGSGRFVMHGQSGIDGIIARGMVSAASEIQASEWPVHVCPGHEEDE